MGCSAEFVYILYIQTYCLGYTRYVALQCFLTKLTLLYIY